MYLYKLDKDIVEDDFSLEVSLILSSVSENVLSRSLFFNCARGVSGDDFEITGREPEILSPLRKFLTFVLKFTGGKQLMPCVQ
jgi:hypothetical protein